jgi:four helix bundle protein
MGSLIPHSEAMFDFEKLEVYQVVKSQNLKVLNFLAKNTQVDLYLNDEWKKASMNILLNLTEGTGRMSVQEKKQYYMSARGAVFECAAILILMKEMRIVHEDFFSELYAGYEQCSKMLLAMYRSMERQQ